MTFYFAYTGSKRLDHKFYVNYIDLTNIKTIVEPFCGSSAFSFNMSQSNNTYEYHLNDNDTNLINFLNEVIKRNGIKYYVDKVNKIGLPSNNKEYKKNCDDKDIGYYYSHRIYGTRPQMKPIDAKRCTVNLDKYKKIDEFYLNQKIKLTCDDYKKILEQYKDDENAFVYLDPPYFNSFNGHYTDFNDHKTNDDKMLCDNTIMYIDILNYLKTSKCKIFMIINKNAITDYIYKDYKKGEYDKLYQFVKNKTKHLIITNY